MAVGRCLFLALVGGLLLAPQLSAQDATGTIRGRVLDAASQQPLSSVNVVIVGTTRGAVSQNDGSYLLVNVTPGTQTVRASRIGYTPLTQTVTVTAGGSATADFSLQAQAVVLGEIVSIGYGTQKRQAITGSVAVVNADDANKGVITNAQQMLEGRVAGVNVTSNNGEPGAGSQIRIRGGTSISGSNDPLYVIDGVPIDNTAVDPAGFNTGNSGGDAPVRSPLNLLNPADIETITVLKDASATAIYGSRGANGVVLIETKKGSATGNNSEYEFYAATSSPYKYLDVLSGSEYRAFLQSQIPAGGDTVWTRRLAAQGSANTNWERELTRRTATTMNHNLSFAGGGAATRYRASLNYLNQDGIVLSSGLQRVQGRINGTHNALNDKLRLGVNLTAAQNKNDYLQYEQQEGFEGGAFQNMIQFNPTHSVYTTDPATGQRVFYEIGPGSQSVRNPVAMALQVQDQGTTNRVLGNASADIDLLSFLTGRVNVGVDRSQGLRETYLPRVSALGGQFNGLARQANRDNTSKTLQTLLTFHRPFDTFGGTHDVEVVGGYEWSQYNLGEFGAQAQDFLTDFTGYNNLGGGANLIRPFSFREESRLISFFGRANWALNDRYYLTGVIRRDGSSRFGPNNQWAVFPAISGSWRISQESFMKNGPLSDLRLRAGYGLQGNNAGSAYAWRQLLEPSGANYPFGGAAITGVQPTRVANPDLKWEQTAQSNVALDYGFMDNRFTGTIEYYVKNTKDLLLDVTVPMPLPVSTRTENIGRLSNKGVEFNLDGRVWERPGMTWSMGLIFAAERNKIEELGGNRTFIATGDVSGQGQSGQEAQRIMKGEPLGTFWGPVFVGVDAAGKQQFQCVTGSDASCVAGKTTNKDKAISQIIGNANPDYSLGLHSTLNWNKFDFSFLIHSEQGRDVFNNTALVYSTKGNALQDKNFLKSALSDPTGIKEPAIYSSRWIEDGSFTRLQNVTLGYTFDLPYLDRLGGGATAGKGTRVYLSGDNLLLITGYKGYDPEVHTQGGGLATRGIDNLVYPRPRTITGGFRVAF